MSTTIDSAVLERWLADDPAPGDEIAVNQWLDADPSNKVVLREMLGAWNTDSSDDDYEQAERWNALAGEIQLGKKQDIPRANRRIFMRAGAAAALIICVAIGTSYLPEKQSVSQTYTTSVGEIANIKLADGSLVTLAPVTTVNVNGRKVSVDGEAVFSVSKGDGSPFVVTSNGVSTRVLGTRFSVRSYKNDARVRVVVYDGKVASGKAALSTVLSAGDIAHISTAGGVPSINHSGDVSSYFAWTTGNNARLAFEDATVSEVLIELGHWYPVEFLLADPSLANRRVSVTFESKRLNDVVNLLGAVLGVKVNVVGGVVNVGE